MKNPVMSFWLSSANQAAGWWMGQAANAVRAQQRAAVSEMTKAVTGAKPKRKRRVKRKAAARRY
jgi:hypothetical protein